MYVHVALFVCLTLLASFFLHSHLSFKISEKISGHRDIACISGTTPEKRWLAGMPFVQRHSSVPLNLRLSREHSSFRSL